METANYTTFQSVARELADSLETARRPDGERFYRFKDDAPGWIESASVAHGAHVAADGRDCRLPCDWIYSLIYRAAMAVADCETADDARDDAAEFADGAVDIYDNSLMAWAANPYNRALADDAANDLGVGVDTASSEGALSWARGGQYIGAERVYLAIVDAVDTEAESR
jgi:hypothetical protein